MLDRRMIKSSLINFCPAQNLSWSVRASQTRRWTITCRTLTTSSPELPGSSSGFRKKCIFECSIFLNFIWNYCRYDFETNKKNNLIFYGIPNEINEKEPLLILKVKELIKTHMKIRRDISITTATRMYTGPEVLGTRPVCVTFEEFRDREEILKNSKLLKKPTISVTEDLSKRTRIARQELRKFMRHVKRVNPEKRCLLQYDKLYIDGKLFAYSEAAGKVEQQVQGVPGLDKVQSDDSETLR